MYFSCCMGFILRCIWIDLRPLPTKHSRVATGSGCHQLVQCSVSCSFRYLVFWHKPLLFLTGEISSHPHPSSKIQPLRVTSLLWHVSCKPWLLRGFSRNQLKVVIIFSHRLIGHWPTIMHCRGRDRVHVFVVTAEQVPYGRCRAYIFPIVINFPIGVSAHARQI